MIVRAPDAPSSARQNKAATRDELIADIHSGVEKLITSGGDAELFGHAHKIAASNLPKASDARKAFLGFKNDPTKGLAAPTIHMGTALGQRVYIVAGSLSDTGDLIGYFDVKGQALTSMYTGQGERGVNGHADWR